MSYLAHIADRVVNRPLLILPEKAAVIVSVLSGRIGLDAPEASRFEGSWSDPATEGRNSRPFKSTQDGVAVLTVTGSLVNRGAWIGANSGLTSYEGIRHQLKAIGEADDVHAAILDLHTPGGEAVGAFETAEAVRELAAKKPVIAVVNGMAASAGYALASGATEIVTTETGMAGSIGVVLLHADFSKYLETEGIKPTLIFAGAHKVDGNPYEPLTEQVRSDLQDEVNAFYESFLRTVSAGRGQRLTVDAARSTEARTLIGPAAVDAGLADRVGSFDSILAELSSRARSGRGSTVQKRSISMDSSTGTPAAETSVISQAQHETAVSTARREGEAAGAQAATGRLATVLGAEGIKGDGRRMGAALDLAVKSASMSADDVVAFVTGNVAATPDVKQTDTSAAEHEDKRMAGSSLAQPSTDKTQKSGLAARIDRHANRT
ncbi:MAG TPA: S49 family peptidase [Pseudorhizobium sp.]|nr:S49 family peptidase [Pseudorhizobium sp.]